MAREETYLKPIKSKSVVQQVIDRITEAIIEQRIKLGDKIPTEQDLAQSLGVSRNSVREAIKIMVSYGVLEIRRPEGTFVCQGFNESMIDPLLYGIILSDEESMESLKELREWIDIGILYKASRQPNEEDLKKLEDALAIIKIAAEHKNAREMCDADDEFHQCMAEMTHNILFYKIAHVTRLLTKKIRYQTVDNMAEMGKLQEMYDVHFAMYQYIKNKERTLVDEIVRQGYFYEYGVLEDKKNK